MELVNAELINTKTNARPVVQLKFRDGRITKYRQIKGIYPYFYIPSGADVKYPHLRRESGYHHYLGTSFDKISFRSIDELVAGKRNAKSTAESDIPYLTRFLIDCNLTFSPNRRVMYFDIEVERGEGSLDAVRAPNPVIVIVLYDNFTDHYQAFALSDYDEPSLYSRKDVTFHLYDDEKDMLTAFFDYVQSADFDVTIGWNSSNYDLPYLWHRSGRDDLFATYHREVYFRNTQPLDLMVMYREFVERGGRQFLDHVARLVLGKSKTKSFAPLAHCIEDVMLTKEIDNALQLSALIFTFQNLVPLNSIDIMSRSNIIETYLLKRYHNRYVLPNKPTVKHKKYEGAVVRDPVKGLHENVTVLDLVSLYPSIVMHFNISPDRELRNPGILVESIRELFRKRMEYKRKYKEKKDSQSAIWNTAYKYLINASVGMLGYSRSRFYNSKLAAEVTAHERKLLTQLWHFLETEKGVRILYGDTDSCFVITEEPEKLMEEVNDWLHQHWGPEFLIDLDKYFSRLFLFDKKKNYFGLDANNKLKITGTVVNRTSCPMYLRNKLMEAFRLILEGKSTQTLKHEAHQNLKKQDIMDIAEWVRLDSINPKVETAHLRAARLRLKLYHIPYYKGEKLPIVPLKDTRMGYLAIHETITDIPPVDYDAIFSKWFLRPLSEIENIVHQNVLDV